MRAEQGYLPRRARTDGTVSRINLISCQMDKARMYRRSIRIHSAKLTVERP